MARAQRRCAPECGARWATRGADPHWRRRTLLGRRARPRASPRRVRAPQQQSAARAPRRDRRGWPRRSPHRRRYRCSSGRAPAALVLEVAADGQGAQEDDRVALAMLEAQIVDEIILLAIALTVTIGVEAVRRG